MVLLSLNAGLRVPEPSAWTKTFHKTLGGVVDFGGMP